MHYNIRRTGINKGNRNHLCIAVTYDSQQLVLFVFLVSPTRLPNRHKAIMTIFPSFFQNYSEKFFPRQRLISRERMLPDVNSTTSGICYGYRAKLNMPRFSITDTKIVSCLTTRRIAKYLPSVRTFLRSCVPIFQNSNRSTWHVLIEKFQQTY